MEVGTYVNISISFGQYKLQTVCDVGTWLLWFFFLLFNVIVSHSMVYGVR